MPKKDEVDQFYKRSREFLQSSELQIEKEIYSLAVFSMEQSLQLLLKGRLVEKGADFPRTHSVRRLMKLLSELSEREDSKKIEGLAKKYTLELAILEDAYITTRYGERDFEKEETESIAKAVKVIMDGIRH